MNKQKRLDSIAEQEKVAHSMVGALSERDKFMIGIGLYWGEGVKAESSTTALINSNPEIIKFGYEWFRQLGVPQEDFSPYVYVSEVHKPRAHAILAFWQTLLGMSDTQLNKIIFLKGRPKKKYENYEKYYGILSLRVRRSSNLKYKIKGLIKACGTEPT